MSKFKTLQIFEQDEDHWYQEELEATRALAGVEKFIGAIHDPACGGGNIITELTSHGYDVTGSDIVERGGFDQSKFLGVKSFYDITESPAPNIVTNPPFFKSSGTEQFIQHALQMVGVKKLAIYTNYNFIFSIERARNFFPNNPPNRIYAICPRVNAPPGKFIRNGGRVSGATKDAVWIVWDKTIPYHGTTFGWATFERPKKLRKIKTKGVTG